MDTFTFCFKGGRTYVHGTDLYNGIIQHLESHYPAGVCDLDLWIRRIATNNMEGRVFDIDEPTPLPPVIVCRFDSGERPQKLCLFEQKSPVDCRYAYPEEQIVQSANLMLDTKSIRLSPRLPFTVIEIVVALNKALVDELFHPSEGKWYFTRLTLERPLPAGYDSHITVSFDTSFGLHLTRSKVVIDDVMRGDIFFSLVQGGLK